MTQTSPWDLFRAKGASPRVKLFNPGRRTCEMDRPVIFNINSILIFNIIIDCSYQYVKVLGFFTHTLLAFSGVSNSL